MEKSKGGKSKKDNKSNKNTDNKKTKGGKNSNSVSTNTSSKDESKLKACNFVKARHILSEKFTVLEEIYNKLTEEYGSKPPASEFGKYAEEFSECSSKKRGGELGYFGRGKMVGEFEKTAFALKVGEMSGIIKTSCGYHIILVEDRKAAIK